MDDKEAIEMAIAKYEEELKKATELVLRLQGALLAMRELLKQIEGEKQ